MAPTKCENGTCIGGCAFRIRNRIFCSPQCGNEYWGLTRSDDDYWPHDETDDETDDELIEYETESDDEPDDEPEIQ